MTSHFPSSTATTNSAMSLHMNYCQVVAPLQSPMKIAYHTYTLLLTYDCAHRLETKWAPSHVHSLPSSPPTGSGSSVLQSCSNSSRVTWMILTSKISSLLTSHSPAYISLIQDPFAFKCREILCFLEIIHNLEICIIEEIKICPINRMKYDTKNKL